MNVEMAISSAYSAKVIELLAKWNLEYSFEEIVQCIRDPQFEDVRQSKSISSWSATELISWIRSLSCLRSEEKDKIEKIIIYELINGEVFQLLIFKEYDEFLSKINYTSYLIFKCILQGWFLPVSLGLIEGSDTTPLGKLMYLT
jgi:hypothetical protein